MTTQISLIALVVPDYDEALAFYVDKLAFTLTKDIDLGAKKRWVTVSPNGGGTEILLARAADDAQRSAIGNQTGGRVGFFLSTTDFDTDYSNMRTQGVHFEEEPRQEPYGRVVVWCDPFGNRWDLIEYA